MADPDELVNKMKVLSDAYAAKLPEKFAQLERTWINLSLKAWDEEGFRNLHRMAHSLTGSSKTFGFSALSDGARNLENELKLLIEAGGVLNTVQHEHIEKQNDNRARHAT